MEQKQAILEVSDLLEIYCEKCFLNSHLKKEHGKRYAQRFCIKQCTVGQKLKQYGEILS